MEINKKNLLTTALIAVGGALVVNQLVRKSKESKNEPKKESNEEEELNASGNLAALEVPMLDVTYDQTISNVVNDIVSNTAIVTPQNVITTAKSTYLKALAYKNLYFVGDTDGDVVSLPYYKGVKVKGKTNAYKLSSTNLKNHRFPKRTAKGTPTNMLGFLRLIGVDKNNGMIVAQYTTRAAFMTLLDPNDIISTPLSITSTSSKGSTASDVGEMDVSKSNRPQVFTAFNNTKLRTSPKINDGWWNNVAKVLPQKNSYIGELVGTVQPTDQTNKINPITGELYNWRKVKDGKNIYYLREDVVNIKYPPQ